MPYKGKCFSTCRKRTKAECDHPQCRYVNGNQYKYCRLNQTYKMNEACEPELRQRADKNKKGTRKSKKPIVIVNELPLSPPLHIIPDEEMIAPPPPPTRDEIAEFRERVKKANATRKIKGFMKKHENKRRARFLKAVCSDADVCMAFGTESAKIKHHFDDFNNFDLLSKPVKELGKESVNGFVRELVYEKDGYTANAILKSSTSPSSDNLLYEGLVGQFLNRIGKQYPSFLETYGIYSYDPKHLTYYNLRKNKQTDPAQLKVGLSKMPIIQKDHLAMACQNSVYMSVLIQHLNDAETVGDLIQNDDFVAADLLNVLYQVYMPLAMMANKFTHYDLHYENVLLYEPVKGKYIHYHYHVTDYALGGPPTVVSFKCKYIAKIIDYGRSYYNDAENPRFTGSSSKLYAAVCADKKCVKCGKEKGFKLLEMKNKAQLEEDRFICSQIHNQSHDLRLAYMTRCSLKMFNKTHLVNPAVMNVLEKVSFGEGLKLTKFQKDQLKIVPNAWIHYGTEEKLASGLPLKINNVTDAYTEFERLVSDEWAGAYNDAQYAALDKLGDLHIYDDGRPMRYVPV